MLAGTQAFRAPPLRDPRRVLREAGLSPKKSFGQNFLVSPAVLETIAATCVPPDEVGRARVVEIGAGTGVLTRMLARRAAKLWAVERDRDLIPVLARELEQEIAGNGAELIEADALSVDIEALLGAGAAARLGHPDGSEAAGPRVLCGNLPYAITGQLLRMATEHASHVDRVVFMIQEEVAGRLTAGPGDSERGALSVFVQAAFGVRRVLRVAPGAFHPPPEVTSAVVELTPLRPARAVETPEFRALVRAAFQARRKTLRNAWARLAPSSQELERAAEVAGVSLAARGETLDVEAFDRMAGALQPLSAPVG